MYILVGSASPSQNPRFIAKFTRNGSRGRFYIDDSYFVSGLGSVHWTQRNRISLVEIKDFVAEQPIDVSLLTRFERDGQKIWRWGPDSNPSPTTAHGIFASHALHRSRIVFISDDALPEYFYFGSS
jgi:hypothetical protein